MAFLEVNPARKGAKINRNIYGHFSEHLGRCIYNGLFVGENSPIIRDRILHHLAYMHIVIDEVENHKRGEEVVISMPGPGPKVLVIPTNEELSIARQTFALVAGEKK